MKTVIMAGGKGTRIAGVYSDIPKPMIKIGGKPILEHIVLWLKRYGHTDIIISTGYLKEKIHEYFGNGEFLGVNIQYYDENEPLGTAGVLYQIQNLLTEDFLLINGDIMFDIDLERLLQYHFFKGGLVTLVAHPNDHPYDSGLLIINEEKQLVNWIHKEDVRDGYFHNCVNAGIHILSSKIFDIIPNKGGKKVDLDRDILKPLIASGQIYIYQTPEYIKDMGTPERYYSVCSDYESGLISRRNLKYLQKAIFLDRDGTINKLKGFISSTEQMELLPNVGQAIAMINKKGYLAIVVTNQPVIARGECSYEQLDQIHAKMETLLGEEGAYVDDLFFCPHHPDKGFEGERLELKINCDCRKPKPGMILDAAKKYNIDLSQSFMVGDDSRDVLAGRAARCISVLIGENDRINSQECMKFYSLYEFCKSI